MSPEYRLGIEGSSPLSRAAGALDMIQCSTLVIILFLSFVSLFFILHCLSFPWW